MRAYWCKVVIGGYTFLHVMVSNFPFMGQGRYGALKIAIWFSSSLPKPELNPHRPIAIPIIHTEKEKLFEINSKGIWNRTVSMRINLKGLSKFY